MALAFNFALWHNDERDLSLCQIPFLLINKKEGIGLEKDLATKKLLNVIETGKVLGVGKIKVYELIKQGYLPALNIGGLKVRRETIDEFLSKYEGYDFTDTKNIKKIVT